ncbi:MAG: hypothetical protein ACOCW2_01700 [Chitinivibrionales bacterium]
MNTKVVIHLIFLPIIVVSSHTAAGECQPLSAPFIKQLLSLAEVSANDTIYFVEPCDVRLTLAAAADFGALAVGVVADSQAMRKGIDIARTFIIGDRVRYIHSRQLTSDISQATVVVFSPLVDLSELPIHSVRPGTRIVSYGRDIEGWEPDKIEKYEETTMYAWIQPADIRGRWSWKMLGENIRVGFNQRHQKIGAEFTDMKLSLAKATITLVGRKLTIVISGEGVTSFTCIGTVRKNTIIGFAVSGTGKRFPWRAKRIESRDASNLLTDDTQR